MYGKFQQYLKDELAAIEEALGWLKKRTNDRADRGVLGHEVK